MLSPDIVKLSGTECAVRCLSRRSCGRGKPAKNACEGGQLGPKNSVSPNI